MGFVKSVNFKILLLLVKCMSSIGSLIRNIENNPLVLFFPSILFDIPVMREAPEGYELPPASPVIQQQNPLFPKGISYNANQASSNAVPPPINRTSPQVSGIVEILGIETVCE